MLILTTVSPRIAVEIVLKCYFLSLLTVSQKNHKNTRNLLMNFDMHSASSAVLAATLHSRSCSYAVGALSARCRHIADVF